MPRVVKDGVFDAWAWCESDVLEWRIPTSADVESLAAVAANIRIDGSNPADLVFVFHRDADRTIHDVLPRELAYLHARGYGLAEEQALAPWAIDDATDLFYEHRQRPSEVLWLAAPSIEALVWGLHDWVHFHNHGPFDDPATTELQCDLVALHWLRVNQADIGLEGQTVEAIARELATLSRRRFVEQGIAPPVRDLEALFSGPYPSSVLGA